jgi:hypothetical protein
MLGWRAMEVISLCPLPVAALLWSAEKRGWTLTVVCKATFRLTPGVLDLATEHLPIHRVERHWDGETTQSVVAPSDLAPFKPKVDVVLVGNAYAPGGRAVTRLKPRLKVGDDIDKELVVHGPRVASPDGTTGPTAAFTMLPLRYERAPASADNPVGVRRDGETDPDGSMLPNIAPAGSKWVEPLGFGPVAAAWPSRRHKLHKHADSWSHASWFKSEIKTDVDLGYFNVAPDDQQVEQLKPGDELVLENLHPTDTNIKTSLPELRPLAYVERSGAEPELLSMRCDTLWIDTDDQLCTMCWRGQLRISGPTEAARCLVVLSEDGSNMSWQDVDELRAECDVPAWVDSGPESLGNAIGLEDNARPGHAVIGGRQLHVRVVAGPLIEPAPRSARYLAGSDVVSVRSADLAPVSEADSAPWSERQGVRVTKLLWHDPDRIAHLKHVAPWDEVLASTPPSKSALDGAQRGAMECLRRGEPASAALIEAILAEAAREESFESPVVVSAGELALSFDELSTLRATITAVIPFTRDDALRDAVSRGRELLGLSWLESGAGVAEELIGALREAFEAAAVDVPPDYLAAQTERVLVQDRCYRYRTLWGRHWVRAAFTPGGARAGVPTYIPEAAVNDLPMFGRFRARILAEIDVREDQYETHPLALRVIALARSASA